MKRILSKLYPQMLRLYFRIRTWWPVWFYVMNRQGRKLFQMKKPALDPLQSQIVQDLREKGIAHTTMEELFPDKNIFEVLKHYTRSLLFRATAMERKKFLQDLWDPMGVLDFTNPFIRVCLDDYILTIVNTYLGMWTKLKYITLQRTVPVGEGQEPIESQRWHRDPQEKRMCKLFIYLTDVDEHSGPFIYIPRSTYGNHWGHLFPQRPPIGSYPPIGAIEKMVPPGEILVNRGGAGTVIFCDTSGLHRGGYATRKERIMFTAFYAAPTFTEAAWHKLPGNVGEFTSQLDEASRFAIRNL